MNADERLQRHDDVMALAMSKSTKSRGFEAKKTKNESKVSDNIKFIGKFNGKCHHCYKPRHKKADCFLFKKQKIN